LPDIAFTTLCAYAMSTVTLVGSLRAAVEWWAGLDAVVIELMGISFGGLGLGGSYSKCLTLFAASGCWFATGVILSS
jgi:hypothetical protein